MHAELESRRGGQQEELIAALESGGVAGVPAQAERCETHLNVIFLAGERAFKLKKAVRLPFVDFSTLEQRRAACMAEVDINRRLGSPFYLGATAVTEDKTGCLRLGGEGKVIDWLVVMRRFPAEAQFDRLAAMGALSVELVERLAERIAVIHAGCAPTPHVGHEADYRQIISTLRATEADGAARWGLQPGGTSPLDGLERELARVGGLIERRRAAGKVRRGHGDLHLRNICLFEGDPTPFDALEFDERMATADVLYDLAFLLMDLHKAGLPTHVCAVMNRYWDAAGEDEEALALLPFFMALRAAVRVAVAVEAGDFEEADTYRRLAFQLLEHRRVSAVAIGGLSGTGKSAVARALAPLLAGPAGARILRSDVLRKRALGVYPSVKAGRDTYAPENRAVVYREIADRLAAAWRAGASVIADATFSVSTTREAIAAAAAGQLQGFWLDAPLHLRLARIAMRRCDASDADAAVAMAQQEPEDISGWRRLDARQPVDDLVASILSELRS